jgi:hypothetical protein
MDSCFKDTSPSISNFNLKKNSFWLCYSLQQGSL